MTRFISHAILATLCLVGTIEAASLEFDAPLFAHWTFDGEGKVAKDQSAGGYHAQSSQDIARGTGLFGKSLRSSEGMKLRIDKTEGFESLEQVTLSAWVRPTRFDRYNEIFRKEAPSNRLLFSFQEHGTLLAFGMSMGRYKECDAKISPAYLCDGNWHHVAATFDGALMRVFLDGRQIATEERAGRLLASGPSPAFIGSSSGTGEFFQGEIDDLRIYSIGISNEQVASLHDEGKNILAARQRQMLVEAGLLYTKHASFAETLAAMRRQVQQRKDGVDSRLAGALVASLQSDFPRECQDFGKAAGLSPRQYLTTEESLPLVGRLQELMPHYLEFQPLTKMQWDQLFGADLAHWKAVQVNERRLKELMETESGKPYSPNLVDLVMKVGPGVAYRPRLQERVAPYVIPSTPETGDYTRAQAEEMIERDWLFQADNAPTIARIRQEIGWAREMATRITAHAKKNSGTSGLDFTEQLAKLTEWEKSLGARPGGARDDTIYFAVRRIKREIQLANPAFTFDELLMVDMPFPAGSEWPHETRHRLDYMAVPGARLLILEGLDPSAHVRQLMPQAPLHGSFWRPDVSFDGRRILFCYKPHNEKSFHLYEIGADGTGLRQLTNGPYSDIDPIYLPDGHIMFSTTRGNTYVRCMPPTNAFPLARCDADGKNIYLISRNNEPDYLPSMLDDGTVIFTRWEYTDKPLWRAQSLWTMNPDGTQVNTFWGNQSVWPDLLKDARQMPGSSKIMFTGSAHHNWFSGCVGMIDRNKGLNFPDGLTKVTTDLAWPESGNGPVDPIESPRYHRSGKFTAYYSPYPLSEQDFLVSANRGGKFCLYLMDIDGNRELIYEGAHNIFHAMPLGARTMPRVRPDVVDWPTRQERLSPKPGTIFSNNVYEGVPKELVGKAKYLRILNIEHKTYTYWSRRDYASTGPAVSMVQSEGVKRIIGTVEIERDGSVSFEAPSGLPLHFQLLDENYCALQTMRSFTGVMPGESRGCVGCHEQTNAAAVTTSSRSLALSQAPQKIAPPPWDDRSVSYPRYVRPVLDKYCAKCHEGDGKGRETFDMTERPGFRMYTEPYVTIIGRPSWGKAYVKPTNPPGGFGIAKPLMVEGYDQRDPKAYITPPPMTALSYKSPLIEIASGGKDAGKQHQDVKVDPISLRRLKVWIDAMCPFRGSEEIREIPDPDFQGIDWLSVRPKVQNAPIIVRPGPVD